jgi:hypothetical protein
MLLIYILFQGHAKQPKSKTTQFDPFIIFFDAVMRDSHVQLLRHLQLFMASPMQGTHIENCMRPHGHEMEP